MRDKITLTEAVDILCYCYDEPTVKEGCDSCPYIDTEKCIETIFRRVGSIYDVGVFKDNVPMIGPEEIMYYYNNLEKLLKLTRL